MKTIFYLGSISLILVLLLASGCTQPAAPAATPQPTTVPQTVPTTEVAVTTAALETPGPTQTLPSIWNVNVQIGSNGQAINPQIIMTFQGGKGMDLIQGIDMQVTDSNGNVTTGQILQPLSAGETISLPGTMGNNDRAEVWVITPQGDQVKIIDQYVPFRSYH
jgi:hypothetical protein